MWYTGHTITQRYPYRRSILSVSKFGHTSQRTKSQTWIYAIFAIESRQFAPH